jgi:hypothetical protein
MSQTFGLGGRRLAKDGAGQSFGLGRRRLARDGARQSFGLEGELNDLVGKADYGSLLHLADFQSHGLSTKKNFGSGGPYF